MRLLQGHNQAVPRPRSDPNRAQVQEAPGPRLQHLQQQRRHRQPEAESLLEGCKEEVLREHGGAKVLQKVKPGVPERLGLPLQVQRHENEPAEELSDPGLSLPEAEVQMSCSL